MKNKSFKDNTSVTYSTRTYIKKTTGVLTQAVEEVASSEEEEDADKKEAAYIKASISHLLTLGQ